MADYANLPNTDIAHERAKRKHLFEDAGYEADAPIAAGQLAMLVESATNRPHVAPSTAGAKAYPCLNGITQAEIDSGKWALLRLKGEAPVICAGPINAGDEIMSDANGLAVAHATAAFVCGFLQFASVAVNHKVALEVESYRY